MKFYKIIFICLFLLMGCGGSGGASSSSNSSGTAPNAPTGVTVSKGIPSGSVLINWVPVAGATSYNIYYDTSSTISIVTSNVVTGITTVPPYTISTGLTIGTIYYFAVTAENDNGQSQFSNKVSIKVQ